MERGDGLGGDGKGSEEGDRWKLWYQLAWLLGCAGCGKLPRAAGLRGHRLVEAASARAAAESGTPGAATGQSEPGGTAADQPRPAGPARRRL